MTTRCDAGAVVDLGRGVAVAPAIVEHVAGCPRCSARLTAERKLSADLRALAAAGQAVPRAGLEADLVAALAARGGVQARRRAPVEWAAAAVLALAVSAAVFGVARLDPPRPGSSAPAFVPWPGSEVLPEFESGHLIRVELPVSVLPLLGFPANGMQSDTVEADLLVGQDGLARAVRLAP